MKRYIQRITIIRNDKDHSPESQLEDIEVDDDESNTNGNPSESDPEQGIEDETDGAKVVENETESVAESPETANSQNEESFENEEDLKEIKESESVSIDIDDEADDSKGTESKDQGLDDEEERKEQRDESQEDIAQHTESPKIEAITDTVTETNENTNNMKNVKNPKNQKIGPYESVEEYLLKDGDGQKRRASLRSAKQQKIRIAPMGDQQWNIVFAESHISTSDKVQIRKLIEMNFDRSYVRDAMSGMDQNPLKYILFKNEKDQIVSFLSYIERNGLWFLVRDIVTMKGYDHRLGSMLLLALQWQFERKGLDFIHRLHAEVEVDDTKFWDQEELRMVNVEKYNKRLSVIGNQVKRNQDLCEYIWIGTVDEAEKKLLEYLNMFHFKVPCSK